MCLNNSHNRNFSALKLTPSRVLHWLLWLVCRCGTNWGTKPCTGKWCWFCNITWRVLTHLIKDVHQLGVMKAHVNVPFMDRTMHFLTFPFCSSVQHLTAVRGWLLERFRGNSKITYILPRLIRNSVRCSSCSYQTDNSQEQWGWQADFAFSLDVRQPRTVRFVSISEQQLIISLCMCFENRPYR